MNSYRRFAVCCLIALITALPHLSAQSAPDDVKTFDEWVRAQEHSEDWDNPGEALSRYKVKLRSDGLSEAQADAIVSSIDKQILRDETEFWNKVFSEPGHMTFTRETNETLARAVQGRKPGTALDVEMGQGRNAVFLAQQGWTVTGFDISQEALSRAQEQARKLGVKINTVLSRDTDFSFGKEQWDLIVATYPMDRHSLPKIQDALKPGGLFVTEGFHEEVHGPAMRYRTGELLERFRGFRIYRYEEVITKSDWGGSEVRVVKFVGEKPPANPK
jgi:protein-L-isoaspartate O-methyltransferase